MLPPIRQHLNFYRIHILFFAFTPLIFSGIFYASNGRYKISYVDSLFNCVSAMTVCGLATVNMSSLTPWQQVLLFIQMCLGSPVLVSWVMVYIRKYYFEKKFEYIIETAAARRKSRKGDGIPLTRQDTTGSSEQKGRRTPKKLRTDMIRRMDEAPKLVNPSGWISEGDRIPMKRFGTINSQIPTREKPSSPTVPSPANLRFRRLSDPGVPSRSASPQAHSSTRFARTPTVEFSTTLPRRRARIDPGPHPEHEPIRPAAEPLQHDDHRSMRRTSIASRPVTTSHTYSTHKSNRGAKHSGFGGFPMPHEILQRLFDALFPTLRRKLTRTVTIPATMTITSQRGDHIPPGAKIVPYVSFEAVVGRNSAFPLISEEQMEELGGVEYRALNALLWIVAGYHIGVHLVAFIVIASYMSIPRWKDDFLPPALNRPVSSTWFSLFQTVSAYTNTGTSLVDQSMVPFQEAYPMIIFMIILILAGNTAFPIFLRATRFFLSKIVPRTSRLNETLQFLLDHPRRCFIYLFPSHQTWFLLTVVIMLNVTDWFSFMVLDIGTPAIEAIPVGVRLIDGLLQAVAVRAAGFATVTLSALAPAVKVLYVIMMYISVYPIAMSVRSTNVYEEQSLGVFRNAEDDDEDPEIQLTGPRMTVWSRYLTMHARKQLSFDMWWLGLALFLVCLIERPNLDDDNKATWFNIFDIVFELTSAYGTVGLSLGIPTENYSFSGAFRPLSKLIVCLVMLRGRHRGLPVAIDRAVMLPSEYQRHDEIDAETASQYFSHGNSHYQDNEGSAEDYAQTEEPSGEEEGLSVLQESRQASLSISCGLVPSLH
ncbi:hypothetical protein BT96DRAFT_965214 [Gymnopus androsaceus JB14]|uniref:Potassium transport protein n=1 Tax=Gymnopus androsaceus JB14 TaxID=1447944 RepID=A0A6A4HS85_9AGAR|nr:hypothetical protein BT96DRAFT_965214 [Gymnopus androsaceus JB14]